MTDWYIDQNENENLRSWSIANLFHINNDQYVGDKLITLKYIPKKTESRWEITLLWTSLKIQNLRLACKMDRPFILSNQ
jgi:hypothetical protein